MIRRKVREDLLVGPWDSREEDQAKEVVRQGHDVPAEGDGLPRDEGLLEGQGSERDDGVGQGVLRQSPPDQRVHLLVHVALRGPVLVVNEWNQFIACF